MALRQAYWCASKFPLPLILAVLWVGCSDEVAAPPPQDNAPNPEGVLLEGDPATNAIAATEYQPPYPTDPGDLVGELLATRLEAIIAPDATVGAFNDLLTTHNLRINSMGTGDPVVSLKIPRIEDEQQARALAQQLTLSGLLFARPAFASSPEMIPASGRADIKHLTPASWPAAWSAAALAISGQKVKVYVPDFYMTDYGAAGHHPYIDAQTFVLPSSSPAVNYYTFCLWGQNECGGNHGFAVSGVIGANFDANPVTGTSPNPTLLLDIRSIPIDRLTPTEMIREIWAHLGPGRFVLNMSLGYAAPVSSEEDKAERSLDAMYWRSFTESRRDDMFIALSAGNFGRMPGDAGSAKWDYYNNADLSFDDLRSMANLTAVSPALAHCVEQLHTDLGVSDTRATNGLLVGSSDIFGNEVPSSSRDSHVRCVADAVVIACHIADLDGCAAPSGIFSGTSFAAPQVAGLAAYLWNLDPSLTPERIANIIKHAYDQPRATGLVDAYIAVLAVDNSISNAPVRSALLDIAGASPASPPNLRFDEMDLESFLDEFSHFEALRSNSGNTDPDYSRSDLNGDGWTGGEFRAAFDLTVDDLPQWTTSVPQSIEGTPTSFDETAVSDVEILLYYAYSNIYSGDPDRRSELFCQFPKNSSKILRFQAFPGCSYPSIQLTSDPADEFYPSWSPDSSQIMFVSRTEGVRVIPATGGTATPLAVPGQFPAWSPDGTEIAFWEGITGRVAIMPATGGSFRTLPGSVDGIQPTWSPDGLEIAYSDESHGAIKVVPVNGGSERTLNLIELLAGNNSPDWSPDGNWVVFAVGDRVAKLPSSGGAITDIINDYHFLFKRPSWSPDGSMIAVARREGFLGWNIIVIRANGGAVLGQLTSDGESSDPSWSPDGTRIAYVSRRSGNFDIWVVDVP